MQHLVVGVGEVRIRLRFAESLKDKRQVLQSLSQRLKNEGFSVVEAGNTEDFKTGTLGFAYAGKNVSHVEGVLKKAFDLFRTECEILKKHHEVLDYSNDEPEYLEIDDFPGSDSQ